MSFLVLSFANSKSYKNLSLKNSFTSLLKAFRKDRSLRTASPLGSYYGFSLDPRSKYSGPLSIGLTEVYSEDPTLKEMKKSSIQKLYSEIINGDNYLKLSMRDSYDYEAKPPSIGWLGTLEINLGSGDDILDYGNKNRENDVLPSYKIFKVDAGEGDDIINCEFIAWNNLYEDYGTQKSPKAIFKGGNGRDVFYGVPNGIEVVIKDFNTDEDSIGLNGKRRRYGFYETSKGVAMYDKKYQDGLLLLKGVDSLDSVNIVNETIF